MKDASIATALGKVMIAAAWADGKIQPEEVDCLKDLLYMLPDLDPKDLKTLDQLLETPVQETERLVLLDNLASMLKSREDRAFALYALDRVVTADGLATEEELKVIEELKASLRCADKSFFQKIQGLIHKPLITRLKTIKHNLTLGDSVEYIMTKKAEDLRDGPLHLNLPNEELYRLCLASVLVARIIWADYRIKESEVESSILFLQEKWGLSLNEARFVIRFALDPNLQKLDIIRVCREFYKHTTEVERVTFLDILFNVAVADGILSNKEVDEILNITANIKLEQNDFQQALAKAMTACRESIK